jgi:tetratricopeptide (TPR) repeat protein
VDFKECVPNSRTNTASPGLKHTWGGSLKDDQKPGYKDPKSMIKKLPYAAFAALILMPFAAGAQDVENAGPMEQTVPVAEEDTPTEEIAADREENEERLLEEFARYRRLLQEGTLDEADVTAKRIVELAIKVYGPQSRETASALNNLGIVQHSTGQYDAAIQNFTSAIEIIEVVEDRLNAALVNPLKGLGAAQLSSGRPDEARRTFERASHITHVNEGPHNLEQIEILESIAETYIRMGNVKAARDTLDRIHALNVKHFEENPLGLLPSLMTRADWQHRAGYFADERSSYRRAIRIIEAGSGKNDPLLVEPLRRLGESFYFFDVTTTQTQQQGMVATGEMYFKRAVRIAERTDGFDLRELARTQLALGDYYTYLEKQSRARRIYRDVWAELSTGDERLALRDELFRDPVPIWTEPLPEFAGDGSKARADIRTGRIVVDFSVSVGGRVRELRSEAFPPEFTDMLQTVHRQMRQRVYRPRVVDGVPVESAGLKFEHPFSYSQSELNRIREAAAPQPAETEPDGEQPAIDEASPSEEAPGTEALPDPDSD